MSYINFVEINDSSRKTKQFYICNIANPSLILGYIVFFPQWRKYTLKTNPQEHVIFDVTCLREIADFCEKETKQWKETLQKL